jgi:hypothetical protein
MKILLLGILVWLAIGLAVPGYTQQQKDTLDPKIAQQIRALMKKYDEAFNRSDSGELCFP